MIKLGKLLANLGYGSRKEVARMIKRGAATDLEGNELTEKSLVEPEGVLFLGEELDPVAPLTIILNKPCGYTCTTDDTGDSVYELLPYRMLKRNPIVACVGRLDKDTSGMLIMTDDGKLQHKIIHPKSNVGKVYDVLLDRPLTGKEAEIFESGEMLLKDEIKPLKPAQIEVIDEKRARVTLHEGRYHQVRRMFAAVGNHVLELKRISMGNLAMPDDIEEGDWRMISDEELAQIFGK